MYKNPIIFKDYSDPDVIKYHDTYYMIASSFNYFPGLPLLESKDLVNWNLKKYIIDYMPGFDTPRYGDGVWAPSMRYFNNLFYIFIPIPDEGIFVITSPDLVNFSEMKNVYKLKGLIDPCPYYEDGFIYVAVGFAKSRIGFNSKIGMFKLDLDLNLVDEYKIVFDGTNTQPVIEGPKVYKRNDYYYILCPAGSVETGWQVALRSKNLYGPYEEKIVMIQGDSVTNGPHQGALVQDDSGNDWFIHFQDLRVYGRITHLQPVSWINDWPIIGKYDGICGRPVLEYENPKTKEQTKILIEDYNFKDKLSLEYQFPTPIKDNYYEIRDSLILNGLGKKCIYEIPNIISRKIDRLNFVAKTSFNINLENDSYAGISLFGEESITFTLKKENDEYFVELIKSIGCFDNVIYSNKYEENSIFIKMIFIDKIVRFSYSKDDINYIMIDIPVLAKKGRWVSGKIALLVNGYGNASYKYLEIVDIEEEKN